jgi:hypothetical protein
MKTVLLIYVIVTFIVWFIGWLVLDKRGIVNSHVSFIFEWYDGWVGFYWDKDKKFLYIFLLPFLGIIIKPYRNNFK